MKKNLILVVLFLSAFSIISCSKFNDMFDMPEKMDKTVSKMDQTYDQIKKTNKAVHLQTLMVALDKVEKIENFDKLFPVPTSVLPYAKTFAEEVEAHEVVELTYTWIKDIREVAPIGDLDDEGKVKLFKDKMVHLYGLYAIAGFLPDNIINEIIATDVEGSSRFEETALQLLALRVKFIRDILLKESILSLGIKNSGTLDEAIMYMNKVDFILNLDRVNDVKVSLYAQGVPADFTEGKPIVDEQLTTDEQIKASAAFWTKIKQSANAGFSEMKPNSSKRDPAKAQEKFQKEQNKFQSSLGKVQQKINDWAARLP